MTVDNDVLPTLARRGARAVLNGPLSVVDVSWTLCQLFPGAADAGVAAPLPYLVVVVTLSPGRRPARKDAARHRPAFDALAEELRNIGAGTGALTLVFTRRVDAAPLLEGAALLDAYAGVKRGADSGLAGALRDLVEGGALVMCSAR